MAWWKVKAPASYRDKYIHNCMVGDCYRVALQDKHYHWREFCWWHTLLDNLNLLELV